MMDAETLHLICSKSSICENDDDSIIEETLDLISTKPSVSDDEASCTTYNMNFHELEDEDVFMHALFTSNESFDEVVQLSSSMCEGESFHSPRHSEQKKDNGSAFSPDSTDHLSNENVVVISDDSSMSTSESLCDVPATQSLEDAMKKLNACMQKSARSRSLIKKSLSAVYGRPSKRFPIVVKKKALSVGPSRDTRSGGRDSYEIPYGQGPISLVTKMKRAHRLMRKGTVKNTGVNNRSKELASRLEPKDDNANRRILVTSPVAPSIPKCSSAVVAYPSRESNGRVASASISDFLRNRKVSSFR